MEIVLLDPATAGDVDLAAVHAAQAAAAAVDRPLDPPPLLADLDTAVVPAHRGHGLGRWIKSAMLVRLRAERPDVTEIETGNSTASQHMLAINQRLGFRPWQELNSWQGEVPELSARLG